LTVRTVSPPFDRFGAQRNANRDERAAVAADRESALRGFAFEKENTCQSYR